MKKIILSIFIILSLSSQFLAKAWDWDTHKWIAEKICNDFNCQCLSEIKEGSIIPDRDFKDFRNHVYYNPNTCKPSPYYTCPSYFNDAALRETNYWLNKAKDASSCERWKYIGIASHYFFDSKVIWHQVINESYYGCHKPFEDKVGEKFKYGEKNWTVCQCEQCVSYDDFLLWIEEFERKLDFLNTSCIEGWKCKTPYHKGYQHSDCGWSNISFCVYGCENGECKEKELKKVGESCLWDSDCETNKCLGFKCAEEWRECWSNYDCKLGYCKDGKCVLPNVEIYGLWENKKIKIREIKPNSRLDINMSNFPIRNISIYSKTEMKNVEININTLYDWEIEKLKIEKPAGKVYKYFNITIENATFYDINKIEIEFNVEKSWINRFNIDETSIRLLRYYENKWNELRTWKVSEDEYNFYYKAQTPFFSIFAITGIIKLQQSEKSTLPLSKELQGESIQQQEEPRVEKETSTITIQPQKEPTSSEGGIHTVLVFSVVFIVIIVIGLGYIIFRKFKRIRERKNNVIYRIKH